MTEEKKFLDEFPIISSSGYDLYRRLVVSNKEKSYTTDVIVHCIPEQLGIISAISHEGIDSHLLPRLTLVRDVYNKLVEKLKNEKPNGEIFGKNFFDLAFSEKVLPPRFYLSLDQQGLLRDYKTHKAEEFSEIYTDLVNRVCAEYNISDTRTTDDWLHGERIILPVRKGYTFELTKPTGFIQTFEIHADNNQDYTSLENLSETFMKLAKTCLGEKINIYDDKFINCHFNISLDITVPKKLSGRTIERFLLNE